MNSALRVFGFLTFSILATSLQAQWHQTPSTYGLEWQSDSNIKMQVAIEAHGDRAVLSQDNQKVSGTNVEFKFSLAHVPPLQSVPPLPSEDPPNPGVWDKAALAKLKVSIGGNIVLDEVPPANTPPNVPIYPGYSRVIRFASIHFPDGSCQELKVEGTFTLVPREGGGTKQITVTKTVPVKIYNKLGTFATREDYVPGQGMQILPNPSPKYWSSVSKQTSEFGKSIFPGQYNHGIAPPATLGVQDQVKTLVLDSLIQSTFLLFCTHGAPGNFRASLPDANGNNEIGYTNPNEVTPKLGTNRTDTYGPGKTPHHHIAIFYACSLLGTNQSWVLPIALGTAVGNGVSKVNRTVIGMGGLTYSVGFGGNQTFYDHFIALDELMQAGVPIRRALDNIYTRKNSVKLLNENLKVVHVLDRGDSFA